MMPSAGVPRAPSFSLSMVFAGTRRGRDGCSSLVIVSIECKESLRVKRARLG